MERHAGAILEIDLAALAANYKILRDRADGAVCAAVLKADAYGLGADRVGPALAAVGCRDFFVAHLGEGISLRQILGPGPTIYILHGPMVQTGSGVEDDFLDHDLIPVLNSPEQLEQWAAKGRKLGQPLAAALQIDTGMNRLGLSAAETSALSDAPERLGGIDLRFVVSHLACADEADHGMNLEQRQAFDRLRAMLPATAASLANSSGIFLGPDYHYDLVRPGIALYGGNPTPGQPNPMKEVVRLTGRILQVREIDTPQTVGYGATHRATGPRRIATVPVGYADGYLRSLSGRGMGGLAGVSVPIVGRVSMDLITLDVTDVPPAAARPGALIDLIGGGGIAVDDVAVDNVAARAGTIGYEILTSLGHRYCRRYHFGNAGNRGIRGYGGGGAREGVVDG
ncbi:MAG: alanine racemase [Rhodospirillaceae bacterium]|nr:alanine racemase [Rhodospirillaceae bacterium]MBT4689729.1 alanine racemase [Rhodospirillaceae bacterium]MBT5080497.1 alanine racemase [Rhodospirillaceae bacterium]MBT5523175.1 alanine racemase [Rhodospirillaceae bacterium]MBT5879260.1 alanine racemase [Rhodospirillaceae bacterium]